MQGRSDLQKKLFSAILVVGGTSLIESFGDSFEERVFRSLPELCDIERVEVIYKTDLDARLYTLRGAAMLANLEASKDLWITQENWKTHGIRTVKQKASFVWPY